MQITHRLRSIKLWGMGIGLLIALGFTSMAQAWGPSGPVAYRGCDSCVVRYKVVKYYKHYPRYYRHGYRYGYRTGGCGYTCNTCNTCCNTCYTCNTCNTCNTCGSYYGYGYRYYY